MRVITKLLALTAICQWAVISFLITQQQNTEELFNTSNPLSAVSPFYKTEKDRGTLFPSKFRKMNLSYEKKQFEAIDYEGVAATLMINAPKWFQRRYTTMVQNILDNTPPSWAVQIFYTPNGQSLSGLEINPGILRMNATHHRLVMTQLPADMVKKFGMKRKKLYWTSEWIWEAMLADNVIVFSGNGALCSNSKLSLLDGSAMKLFQRIDYIGTPWWNHRGVGGDGSISYRNRTAMLDALKFKPYDGNSAEDYFFVQTLKAMNDRSKGDNTDYDKYHVATKYDTQLFGGINVTNFREEDGPPMVISGTLSKLDHGIRNSILELCPEIKRIFPSLHNPACFGAHPDSEGCAKSICALTQNHSHGC